MRTIAAGAQTVLDGVSCPLVLLIELLLTTPVRFATSAVNIEYDGDTYVGAGSCGSIEAIDDSPGENKTLRFVLSAVPADLIALARAEEIRNKPVLVLAVILNPDTHAIEDVIETWSGTLDQMPIQESGNAATISVTAEHRGTYFARPKPLRYTDGDQQRLVPGDTSLRFINAQAAKQDPWPEAGFFRQ